MRDWFAKRFPDVEFPDSGASSCEFDEGTWDWNLEGFLQQRFGYDEDKMHEAYASMCGSSAILSAKFWKVFELADTEG